MSHTQMRQIMHANAPYHTHKYVMSHTPIRHVTHTNASCHTHECVMSHTRTHHVTLMNASCQALCTTTERKILYFMSPQNTTRSRRCICAVTHCNTLQHTATYYNTLHSRRCMRADWMNRSLFYVLSKYNVNLACRWQSKFDLCSANFFV